MAHPNRKDNKDGTLCRRIVEILEDEGPMRSFEIAEWAGCKISTLVQGGWLNAMMLAGRIHIHEQLRNPDGGAPVKVWAAGEGENAVYRRVGNDHKLAVRREHRRRLKDAYGTKVANAMIRGINDRGASRVVIDGRVIYERRVSA